MGAQLITWISALLLMLCLPRFLGAAAVGKLHFALSVLTIISMLATFGTDTLLTKEIARSLDQTAELFGTTLLLRFLFFSFGFAGVLIVLTLFDYPQDTIYVIALIGMAELVWQVASACRAVFQGMEDMYIPSIGDVVSRVFQTLVTVGLLVAGQGLYMFAIVMTMAMIINLVIQFSSLSRMSVLALRIRPQTARYIIKNSWPYLLSSLFLVLYMQMDVVILSLLISEEAIGWYGSADRLFGTLLFLPTVFITAIFPVFSRLFVNEIDPLKRLFSKSFDSMLLLGVPIGVGLVMVANPLVVLIYGAEFTKSGPILAVFGIVLILTYQNILLGRFLISIDKQRAWTIVMAVATIATIPLDYLLIPWCEARFANGALGGAIAFVITELSMMICGFFLIPAGVLTVRNVQYAAYVVLAGLAMAAAVWWLRDLFIGLQIVAGAVVYIGLVVLLPLLTKEDVDLIKELFYKVLSRLNRTIPEAIGGESR